MQDVFLIDEPPLAPWATLLLAHGAGAPMDSTFMSSLAASVAGHGFRVARFEFPYMASRRETGRKRPPDRMPVLEQAFLDLTAEIPGPLFIGGKSMGGRVASLIADRCDAMGVICFGYPFHPPGRPERTRVEHLHGLELPGLILQGTRDPFGKPEEVSGYALSPQVRVVWLDGGDHDLKPLKKSGATQADLIEAAAADAAAFMRAQLG